LCEWRLAGPALDLQRLSMLGAPIVELCRQHGISEWSYFETIDEAKAKIEAWRVEYNESRLHQARCKMTPAELALNYRPADVPRKSTTAGNELSRWSCNQ